MSTNRLFGFRPWRDASKATVYHTWLQVHAVTFEKEPVDNSYLLSSRLASLVDSYLKSYKDMDSGDFCKTWAPSAQ